MFLSGGSQTAVCTRNPGGGSIQQRRCFSAAGPGILFKGRWRQNAAKNNNWRTIRFNPKFGGCILEKTALKWFQKHVQRAVSSYLGSVPTVTRPFREYLFPTVFLARSFVKLFQGKMDLVSNMNPYFQHVPTLM